MAARKNKPLEDGRRRVVQNRRARFEFEFIETFEAGIVLLGSEVKSIRAGNVSLAEAYARVTDGEVWLIGAHIAEYDDASLLNHEPRRRRKLLLHRSEIRRIQRKVKQSGLTLVPVDLYFNERGRAKVTLALARGKKSFDKREAIKKRDAERESRRYRS